MTLPRPITLALAGTLALGLSSGPGAAQSAQDAIVAQLAEQGFRQITISRTFLGRTRIVATSPDLRREIVFNPATGEILRDYWDELGSDDREEDDEAPRIVNPGGGSDDEEDDESGGGNSGPGNANDDEEEDDDERDDEDDEDDDKDDDDEDEDEDDKEDDDED